MYITLETTDECLLANIYVQKIQNYILAWDYNSCCLFDAKNGKFIRTIGHKGDDPRAVHMFYDNFYNPYDSLLYFRGHGNGVLVKYKLNGEYVGKVKIPLSSEDSPQVIAALDSTTLCAFFSNRNGRERKRILLFDREGNVLKLYPNYHYVETNQYVLDTGDGLMYRYRGNLFFKEKYIDTVYHVNKQQLKPEYILNITPHSVSYKDRYGFNSQSSFQSLYRRSIDVYNIYENNNFIAFDYHKDGVYQMCVYNKQVGKTTYYLGGDGLIDDINGFMPIRISAVSDDGTAIGVLNASDICDYMKRHKITSNPNLPFLESILPDDNPVVVFMNN